MENYLSDILTERVNDFIRTYDAVDLSNTCINDFISDCSTQIDDCRRLEDLRELFYDWNFEQEIIYSSEAWEYIKSYVERLHDYSFENVKKALQCVGYESIDSLSTSLIATVLMQDDNSEDFELFLRELEKDDPFEDEEEDEDDDDD